MGNSKSDIDVAYVAKLARLDITDEHAQELQKDMESILEYIDLLTELDVSGIEATAHAAPLTNVMRPDVFVKFENREGLIANAPATVDSELIKVPQVMQGEEESG